MKTSFQISNQLSSSVPALLPAGGNSVSPFQKNISVSGPQGPVCPAGPHQLFSLGKKAIRSAGTPNDCQILAVSSSLGAVWSPINTDTANFFGSNPSHFLAVKNSQLHSIASC